MNHNIESFSVNQPGQTDATIQGTAYQNRLGADGLKVTLFLFSPKFTPNQCRRPVKYTFGGEFQNDLDNLISQSVNRSVTTVDAIQLASNVAHTAVLPPTIGCTMDLHNFNDQWTFLMIVDLPKTTNPIGLVQPLACRAIYSGWITDEPITNANLGGYSLNPNAILSVAHFVRLTEQQTMTQSGVSSIIMPSANYDYVDPSVAQAVELDQQMLFNLKPNIVANATTYDDFNGTMTVGADSQSQLTSTTEGNAGTVELNSDLNSPVHHLAHVIGAITDGVRSQANDCLNQGFMCNINNTEQLRSYIINDLSTAKNVRMGDIPDPASPILLGELMSRYDNVLHVINIDQPSTLQYDHDGSADAPTRRSVFTSVIASSLPSFLVDFGIADIRFRYNSSMRPGGVQEEILCSPNKTEGIFELQGIGMLCPSNDMIVRRAFTMLSERLRRTLFNVIRSVAGDFDLVVHCSLAGSSLIDLQFLDDIQTERSGNYQEYNNLLGGLNSPLIGTFSEFTNNAQQLAAVINNYAGTHCDDNFGGYYGSGDIDIPDTDVTEYND